LPPQIFGADQNTLFLSNSIDTCNQREPTPILERAEGILSGSALLCRDHDHSVSGEEDAEEKDQSESESDEEKDVLDVMKERRFGSRKSDRKRKEIDRFGYQIPSTQVSFTHTASEDSEANGID
jgi:hypothetical protein